MLSQLQKHFQQVTTKIFTPPQPHQAAAAAKLAAKNKMKSSSAPVKPKPIIPPAVSTTTTNKSDSTIHQDQKFNALVQETADQNPTTAPKPGASTAAPKTTKEDIKIQRTKSKSQRIRSIQHAMSKERTVREAQEPFDFWTNVKQFNWKALIVFMICWTILGYYVIPTIKGWKGFKPPTEEEKRDDYNKGKQKLVEDTYRLRQRIEARKMRADRIEGLEMTPGSQQQQDKS